jgi:hypothetical protein
MSGSIMKQVVIGTQYTVDVMQGGVRGKCICITFGHASTEDAQSEIVRLKHKFAQDGVDTSDYLYIIRPVDQCEWVYDDEYIKELEAYARDLYINKLDHDPVDDGLGAFVEGFIEGVMAQQEERV